MNKSAGDYDELLDDDIIELLSENQSETVVAPRIKQAIRADLFNRIAAEDHSSPALQTTRRDEGVWHLVMPKMHVKLLRTEPDTEVASYLIRLDAGFYDEGHDHPLDEDCMILEGQCSLSGVHLEAGDFHFAPKGLPHRETKSDTGALLFVHGANPLT